MSFATTIADAAGMMYSIYVTSVAVIAPLSSTVILNRFDEFSVDDPKISAFELSSERLIRIFSALTFKVSWGDIPSVANTV